jgi:hypothetical protein
VKNKNLKERLKGVVIGAVLAVAVMATMPVFARVAQETITVNFNNIRIAVDGQIVQTELEPFIFDGRTFLPVRDVAEAMGYDVTWENATNTVHLTSRPPVDLNVVPNYPPHNAPVPTPTPAATPQPTATPIPQHQVNHQRNNRPSNPAISLQRAIEIAEEDLVKRGINATFHSDSGMEWEKNQWVWELEFRVVDAPRGRHVIEFYINVDSGKIVKFEQGS